MVMGILTRWVGTEGCGFGGVPPRVIPGEKGGAYVGCHCLVAFLVRPFCCPLC